MNKKYFMTFTLIIFSVLFSHLSTLYSSNTNSSSERQFNAPVMADGNLAKGVWKKRIKLVSKALENIQKKIEDPESDINKKMSPCIGDALKNLYKPIIEGWEHLPNEAKQLQVLLAKEYPDALENSSKLVLMEVRRKSGYHPDVNQSTYHGNMHGEIIIYPVSFDRKYIDCLEGNLFHEILHMACFTNQSDFLGEKIAYACSHKIYKYASSINPDETDPKKQDYSKPDQCTEENCQEEKKDRVDVEEKSPNYVADTPDGGFWGQANFKDNSND
jgi:hypothetical protein